MRRFYHYIIFFLTIAGDDKDLKWLPKDLPENVHMLLSTLPGQVWLKSTIGNNIVTQVLILVQG